MAGKNPMRVADLAAVSRLGSRILPGTRRAAHPALSMDDWLTHFAGGLPTGLAGLATRTVILQIAALLLAALASVVAILRPGWLPARLRTRIVAVAGLATMAPALTLAAVALGSTTGPASYAAAAAVLLACLAPAGLLAAALARSIVAPLAALEHAVQEFDPEFDRAVPAAPSGTPREVAAIFRRLAYVGARLRTAGSALRQSLRQGDQVRADLYDTLQERELEIEQRTSELRQARATLDRLAREDALTGTANRRAFAEHLDRAWRTALREQQPVSILMVDIDHFRAFNEAYGHQQGDSCIRAVANAIRHVAGRCSDVVSRYGGEEFVVVLGNTPLDGALKVGEQMRAAIESLAISQHPSLSPAFVTVSVGVTSTVPVRGAQPETFLLAADRALHAAKEEGRNQVAYSTAARTGLFQALCLPNDAERRLI